MSNTLTDQKTLSSSFKKTLRSRGHHLNPIVLIGKEGITSTLVKSADMALKAHELIKVKVGQNSPVERKEAAQVVAQETGSALVYAIGKVFLLYRPNPELPPEKRITTTSP